MSEAKKLKRGYWYEFYEAYCELCSRSVTDKHRVYDRPKPKHWHERHTLEQSVCIGHFV